MENVGEIIVWTIKPVPGLPIALKKLLSPGIICPRKPALIINPPVGFWYLYPRYPKKMAGLDESSEVELNATKAPIPGSK